MYSVRKAHPDVMHWNEMPNRSKLVYFRKRFGWQSEYINPILEQLFHLCEH